MGGLGCQNFSRSRLARRTLHTQPAVLKALHWNLLSVVPHARGVVENLFSTASGPVSTVLRSRSGAAFCCWLGTWFHTTLLCCNGPCPHDPPRCRLNSSPSHTDAMRNLPQFAKSLGISTVLPCYCIGFHVLLWKLRATSLLVVLVPRLGGLGRQIFFQILAFSKDAASCSQRCSRHYTGTSQCGAARTCGVVENLFSAASGPVSTVLRSRSGAAFCCWLGTWLHTALLCC